MLISAGVGEDASFDVEFCRKYESQVILVDPTPRAITHFDQIKKRFGKESKRPFEGRGLESADAYDMRGITSSRMSLCAKALWKENGFVRFYAPKNPDHVSHSIMNLSNDGSAQTPYVEVESWTLDRLIQFYALEDLAMVKLDIEGAEIEVIGDMIKKGIMPRQILVEFDELTQHSVHAKSRIESAHRKLLDTGYVLVHREKTNCTYYRVPSDLSQSIKAEDEINARNVSE